VTCLFVVDVHQGDSEEIQSSKLPEIGPGPRLGTDHVFGNFHTLWSSSPAVEGVDTVPYYAIEDARESWAPLAVAVSDKSWSDLKSRGEVTLDIKVLPPLPIICFSLTLSDQYILCPLTFCPLTQNYYILNHIHNGSPGW
jgi:hypothetical protein